MCNVNGEMQGYFRQSMKILADCTASYRVSSVLHQSWEPSAPLPCQICSAFKTMFFHTSSWSRFMTWSISGRLLDSLSEHVVKQHSWVHFQEKQLLELLAFCIRTPYFGFRQITVQLGYISSLMSCTKD